MGYYAKGMDFKLSSPLGVSTERLNYFLEMIYPRNVPLERLVV